VFTQKSKRSAQSKEWQWLNTIKNMESVIIINLTKAGVGSRILLDELRKRGKDPTKK